MVLFGDSGEKDPFIYNSFVKSNPGVVKGIIIHEVTGRPIKIKVLEEYKKRCEQTGISYIIWKNKRELRKKMLDAGLLNQ